MEDIQPTTPTETSVEGAQPEAVEANNVLIERLLAALIAVPAFVQGLVDALAAHTGFTQHTERIVEALLPDDHLSESEIESKIDSAIDHGLQDCISTNDYDPDYWVTHDDIPTPDLSDLLANACDSGIGDAAERGLAAIGLEVQTLKTLQDRHLALVAHLCPPAAEKTTRQLKREAEAAIEAHNQRVSQEVVKMGEEAKLSLNGGGA